MCPIPNDKHLLKKKQVVYLNDRHLERMPVILSAAKDLVSLPERSFAALRMTGRTSLKSAHGKSYCCDSLYLLNNPAERVPTPAPTVTGVLVSV